MILCEKGKTCVPLLKISTDNTAMENNMEFLKFNT